MPKSIVLQKKQSGEIIESIFSMVVSGCKEDGFVDIPAFGKFKRRFKKGGEVKAGGKVYQVEDKFSPRFKPAKAFKDGVA